LFQKRRNINQDDDNNASTFRVGSSTFQFDQRQNHPTPEQDETTEPTNSDRLRTTQLITRETLYKDGRSKCFSFTKHRSIHRIIMSKITSAVRLLSTLHANKTAVQSGRTTADELVKKTIFSTEYFPAFLACSMAASGYAGWKVMESRRRSSSATTRERRFEVR
jgi:hypothetical protein